MTFDDDLRATSIVPVIVIKDLAHAVPLAKALVEGGLNILEITLRTDAGLAAIKAIASEVKGAIVGAGTVINAAQFAAAAQAGSKFVVSPGLTDEVVKSSRDTNVPILPGVATGSEIMHGLSLGLSTFKFCPAETTGGAETLNKADLVYISGISLAILGYDDRQAAIKLLGTLKTKVAFDPNIRPALWKSMDEARHTFEDMVKLSSIVLPSRQDYQLLYDMNDPLQQIAFTATLTKVEIALTCDEDGCVLRIGDEVTALPTQAVKVVDTSGAGDSFNGAYLAARLKGKPPQEAVKDGLALAAKVVAQPGALIPR